MTSYWPAIFISLIVHALVIFLVIKGWEQTPEKTPYKPPSYIKATLIDLKTQGKQGAQTQKPKPKKIDLQKKRLEQERLKRLAAEKKRKNQLAKEKAEKEKRLKEKKLAEQRKQQEELKRQAALEQKQLEQQLFEDNLQKERERIEAEQQAEILAQQVEDDKLLSQSYSMLIQQRIQQNWSRPPSARNDMEALLRIQMIPTGEIIDVSIVRSSGNAAYDRSAIQAVKKTRQISELRDMPSRVFEKDFRQFQLIFKPQDLRQ
jgi:colicin import membrane protein